MIKGGRPSIKEKKYFELNKGILDSGIYKDEEGDLEEKLVQIALKFIEIDDDNTGTLDIFNLARLFEKMGTPKTNMEIRKIIKEIAPGKDVIDYFDFVKMVLAKSGNKVLQMILFFNSASKTEEPSKTVAPKKTLSELP